MRITITNMNINGQKYQIKAIDDKHGYREVVTCCKCRTFHEEEQLFWADFESMEEDLDGVPFCRDCYHAAVAERYLKVV